MLRSPSAEQWPAEDDGPLRGDRVDEGTRGLCFAGRDYRHMEKEPQNRERSDPGYRTNYGLVANEDGDSLSLGCDRYRVSMISVWTAESCFAMTTLKRSMRPGLTTSTEDK